MGSRRSVGPLKRDGGKRQRAYVETRASRGMPVVDRIKLHVEIDALTGCWVWQLALVPRTGYGCISIDGRMFRAHRASYEAFVGPIPEGLHIDHLCRNRACVNPRHLEPVTPKVNSNRSPLTHGDETHCPHGHPYDAINTYVDVRTNRRQCRTCRKAYRRLYWQMSEQERAERKQAGLPVVDLAAHFADEDEVAA